MYICVNQEFVFVVTVTVNVNVGVSMGVRVRVYVSVLHISACSLIKNIKKR